MLVQLRKYNLEENDDRYVDTKECPDLLQNKNQHGHYKPSFFIHSQESDESSENSIENSNSQQIVAYLMGHWLSVML